MTYLYVVGLHSSLSFIHCLITDIWPFKSGDSRCLYTWFGGNLSFDNFPKTFSKNSYGAVYEHLGYMPLSCDCSFKHLLPTAGYAYSRYNFLARKQEFGLLLDYSDDCQPPRVAPSTAIRWNFDVVPLNNLGSWSCYHCWWYSMNTQLMKGYFDTVPISLDESAKLDGLDTSVASNRHPSLFDHGFPFKLFGLSSGALSGLCLVLVFLLRDEVDYEPLVLKPLSVTKKSKNRLLCSRCYLIAVPIYILILLPTKECCFRA